MYGVRVTGGGEGYNWTGFGCVFSAVCPLFTTQLTQKRGGGLGVHGMVLLLDGIS